jgi:hypothetical protein
MTKRFSDLAFAHFPPAKERPKIVVLPSSNADTLEIGIHLLVNLLRFNKEDRIGQADVKVCLKDWIIRNVITAEVKKVS